MGAGATKADIMQSMGQMDVQTQIEAPPAQTKQ